MSRLYTPELAEALVDLLHGLDFLVERGVDTRPVSDKVLALITTICRLDQERFGGEK